VILLERVVPTTRTKEKTHESISKTITHIMALPISSSLGSQVSIQDTDWQCRRRGSDMHTNVCGANEDKGGGAKCASGSRASTRNGTAEDIGFRLCGHDEGTDGATSIQQVSGFEREAVLGESFLVEGILRGHRRSGRRDDTEVCKISREARASAGRIQFQEIA
jgi:hypothetical protein